MIEFAITISFDCFVVKMIIMMVYVLLPLLIQFFYYRIFIIVNIAIPCKIVGII